MKVKLQLFITAIIVTLNASYAGATNVSGGIYTNTTWLKSNNPYIVVDTIVVFPGVTLTIEPGVIVKFSDNMRIEVRQATLVANGTYEDQITFTSNSNSPHAGIWDQIWFNRGNTVSIFNYCNFLYGDYAILFLKDTNTLMIDNSYFAFNNHSIGGIGNNNGLYSDIDSCLFSNNGSGAEISQFRVNHSTFNNNNIGMLLDGFNIITNCTTNDNSVGIFNKEGGGNYISYCSIDSNSGTGLILNASDTVTYNEIKFNGTGLSDSSTGYGENTIKYNVIENNSIGILMIHQTTNVIYCNTLCNNSGYNFKYNVLSSSNITIANNYWCSSDSATIANGVYDGFDNINYGLVFFMPIDSSACYLFTGVQTSKSNKNIAIFPNPTIDYITLTLPKYITKGEFNIYDLLGNQILKSEIEAVETKINTIYLTKGIYILEVIYDNNLSRHKFIKQ